MLTEIVNPCDSAGQPGPEATPAGKDTTKLKFTCGVRYGHQKVMLCRSVQKSSNVLMRTAGLLAHHDCRWRFKFAPNFYRRRHCRVRPGVTGVRKVREPELGQKVWFIVYHYIACCQFISLLFCAFITFRKFKSFILISLPFHQSFIFRNGLACENDRDVG